MRSKASGCLESGRRFHQRGWQVQRPEGGSVSGGSRSGEAAGAERGQVGGEAGEEAGGPEH